MRVMIPLLILMTALTAACDSSAERPVVIGSKNFTEQVILAELLAQQIENRTGLPVDRRVNLGGTFICHQALRAGDLDLYVEYTGTALTAILKEQPVFDPDEVYRRVKKAYSERFDLHWGAPLGFSNTFAMIVREEDARSLALKTISDIAPRAADWRIGFSYEFAERADGFPGLVRTYGLQFAGQPSTMELGLLYRALRAEHVDIIAGNSTDGLIEALDLVVLEDDHRYFPPYEAAPVVRVETLARRPEVGLALEELAGAITEESMRRMNYAVDGEKRDVAEVAREFLADLTSDRR